MQARFEETIFAVASGVGRAALTVLRATGPACRDVLSSLCTIPLARRASLRSIRDQNGILLDKAVVVWLPGPGSYTGEDSFELSLHGGAAVLDGVVAALQRLGARQAAPGEFTRRAVIHGRLDLLEAEAVADLIEAETAAQRDQALRQLGGSLGNIYAGWAMRLLRLLAQQEALIDFPDEDLPPAVEAALIGEIETLRGEFEAHLKQGERGERLRTGLVFAIAGRPNAGKSTLINALCQRDIAIVSPGAGTTRDVLEARIEIAGVPVTFLDTAGLRETEDVVEAEGVRRARQRIAEASLILMLLPPDGTPDNTLAASGLPLLKIATKIDLANAAPNCDIAISVHTGAGMDDLMASLNSHVRRLAAPTASPVLTRARHRAALANAAEHLTHSLTSTWPEVRGEELRLAVQSLGRITGRVGVEDILDSVFGQFCIGK